MEQVCYGKFIVLPFTDFQECIQKSNVTSTNPILPKTMSKRSIELFNHLRNYPDKIQFKGKKVVQIFGQSTNVGIDRLFKNLYGQHKANLAEQLLLKLLFKIRSSLPVTLLTKRVLAKIKKCKTKSFRNKLNF